MSDRLANRTTDLILSGNKEFSLPIMAEAMRNVMSMNYDSRRGVMRAITHSHDLNGQRKEVIKVLAHYQKHGANAAEPQEAMVEV